MPKKTSHSVPKFEIKVRVIRAKPGGVFENGSEFNCESIDNAKQVADRLQREFDDDCDPCRTFVYKGDDPVPVYAGAARFFYDRKKDFNRKGADTRSRMN